MFAPSGLKIDLRKISDLSPSECREISRFIQNHSLLTEDYVSREFLSFQNRDIMIGRVYTGKIRLVFSMDFVATSRASYIYWGDLIKHQDFRSINLGSLFFRYLLAKEGIIKLFLKPKSFATFCYNPRILNLGPNYLQQYSLFDRNIDHKVYRDCLDQLNLLNKTDRGFFQDKAIAGQTEIDQRHRYQTKNKCLNDFFYENVLKRKSDGRVYFTGRSLAVVWHYRPTDIFSALSGFFRVWISHRRRITYA